MDRRVPYSLSVLAPSQDGADESRLAIQARLREFILAFQLDNSFIYRYSNPLETTRFKY
jgi:DNA replication licensing factor MCM5